MDKEKALKLHYHAYRLFEALVVAQAELEAELANGCIDVEGMAEVLCVYKKIEQWLKDARSQSEGLVRRLEQQCCFVWVKTTNGEKPSIKTDFCTVTPSIRMQPKIPQRGTAEYATLLLSLMGTPDESIEHDALRPHWPGLVELCGARATAGERSPAGIDPSETVSSFRTVCRLHVDLIEEFKKHV